MSTPLSQIDIPAATAALLWWIGQALVFGTLVAVLTWVLIRLLRGRVSPGLQMALWSIVLVKFLVPIGPGWSFSLVSTYETLLSHVTGGGTVDADAETGFGLKVAGATDDHVSGSATAPSWQWQWQTVVAAGYVLMLVGLGVARIQSYRVFRTRCLALPKADEATRRLVHDVCRRLRVAPMPSIRISDESRAPFVMGIARPLLVLSRRQLVRPDELETVIVHEVTHLRRGDMLVRCLQCLAGTVLFFWPVVAWVNRRIDRVREHACDERALCYGKLTASGYARCLLSAVQPPPTHRLTYQPACMAGSPSTIERRINVILAFPNRSRRRPVWGLLTVAILVAWGGFTLTGVAEDLKTQYANTEEDMRLHAQAVYAQINEYAAGDLDGNGEVTKDECWAFVAAVALQQPRALLADYPEADQDQDGKLGVLEAYQFVRGDLDLTKVHKEYEFAAQKTKKSGDEQRAKELKAEMFAAEMATWHVILDRRAQFVAAMNGEPTHDEVKAIAEKVAQFEVKTKVKQGSLDETMTKIAGLKKKAAGMRSKAAQLDGDKAAKHEEQAQQLEEEAATMTAKLVAGLTSKIAKLEAAGQQEKADELKAILEELEAK
ncbi:MAG: M56 family metallopeptidase [Planctomycetes bacterium]|nr:M56 family metallopeptidase [Planctomycetota bacterium]